MQEYTSEGSHWVGKTIEQLRSHVAAQKGAGAMLSSGSYPVSDSTTILVGANGKITRVDCNVECPPEQAKVKVEIANRYGVSVVLGPWRRENGYWMCLILQQMTSK